jgi:hypothetical protein
MLILRSEALQAMLEIPSCCAKFIIFISSIAIIIQLSNGQLKQCCSCCHAGYFYKKYPGFKKRQQNAQQDFKIVYYYYYPAARASALQAMLDNNNVRAAAYSNQFAAVPGTAAGFYKAAFMQHCKQCCIFKFISVSYARQFKTPENLLLFSQKR